MIEAANGTLHLRANVGELFKCCFIHFNACREFAASVWAPDHHHAHVTHSGPPTLVPAKRKPRNADTQPGLHWNWRWLGGGPKNLAPMLDYEAFTVRARFRAQELLFLPSGLQLSRQRPTALGVLSALVRITRHVSLPTHPRHRIDSPRRIYSQAPCRYRSGPRNTR